jgi:hypothetical protein
MTNCYMVAPGDSVTFRVSRAYTFVDGKFTNTLHVDDSSYGGVDDKFDVEVIWADKADLLSSVTVDDGAGNRAKVTVRANNTDVVGNAVVKIFKSGESAKTPVWSYHIWVTKYQPDDKNATDKAVYENKGNTNNNGGHFIFMDRNLGATFAGKHNSASSIGTGLFYQWGRKDPFPDTDDALAYGSFSRAATSDGLNMKHTINNPSVFYYNTTEPYDWHYAARIDTLWNHTKNIKTIYDPCPSGWRVPKQAGTENSDSPWWGLATTNNGFKYGYKYADNAEYAACGMRNGRSGTAMGKIQLRGWQGTYWTASPTLHNGRCMELGDNSIIESFNEPRSNGCSVRCVRE